MVALVVSASAAALLGLVGWLPTVLGRDIGVRDVTPGLLTVAPAATGVATLGDGRTIALYPSGFRVALDGAAMADTVSHGAPVSAVVGAVHATNGQWRETAQTSLDNVRIDSLDLTARVATYTGTVYGQGGRSLPLTITARLVGNWVQLNVSVPGADAIVIHLASEPATTGLPPLLPDRGLRLRAWWLASGPGTNSPAFTSALATGVTILPPGVATAVDLRSSGRLDIHVWAARAGITVSGTPRSRWQTSQA